MFPNSEKRKGRARFATSCPQSPVACDGSGCYSDPGGAAAAAACEQRAVQTELIETLSEEDESRKVFSWFLLL